MRSPADPSLPSGKGKPGVALIVEDNIIIALEIEVFLQDIGAENCFLAGTVEAALLILEARDIDFAIVDMNLGQESGEDVAMALQQRGVPFLFSTGYSDDSPIAGRFPGVPLLTKPLRAKQLHQMLEQLGVM